LNCLKLKEECFKKIFIYILIVRNYLNYWVIKVISTSLFYLAVLQGITKQMLNYNCCQLVIFNTDNCTSFPSSFHSPLFSINLLCFSPHFLPFTYHMLSGLCDFLVAYFGAPYDCCCQLMLLLFMLLLFVLLSCAYVFAMIKLYFQFISLSLSTNNLRSCRNCNWMWNYVRKLPKWFKCSNYEISSTKYVNGLECEYEYTHSHSVLYSFCAERQQLPWLAFQLFFGPYSTPVG